MHRNNYDADVTTWSPQGRLFQVEYAMEAVKQGRACVGAVSKTHAVIAALKKPASELSSAQRKIFEIDEHVVMGMSGLFADARSLCKYMRTECLNYKYSFGEPMPASRLAVALAEKHQWCTQSYVRRPYGVGLLIASVDDSGPRLHETCPSGNFWEWRAQAIGARSQTAKTYLEKHFEEFPDMSRDDLIFHVLSALAGCTDNDEELTPAGAQVAFVGVGEGYTVLEDDALRPWFDRIAAAGGAGGGSAPAAAAMEVDM